MLDDYSFLGRRKCLLVYYMCSIGCRQTRLYRTEYTFVPHVKKMCEYEVDEIDFQFSTKTFMCNLRSVKVSRTLTLSVEVEEEARLVWMCVCE